MADPLFREVAHEVDEREIAEIVAGYALVAEHCRAGGFDGIELQCSHSSIVRGFLSPAVNHRTDRYGGSLENRARLLLEIVAAVRQAIGRELALGVRLCGDELIEGGTTVDEAVEVARMVEAQGLVDYVNTSIGVATASLFMIEASMQVPPGYALFIPSAIRKAVDLPVIGVGRFKDPLQADRALVEGHCDLVGVVRGQIADADFAAKALAGRGDDIRLCLSCNQECVGRMGLNRWLGCIENPRTGREAEAEVEALTRTPAPLPPGTGSPRVGPTGRLRRLLVGPAEPAPPGAEPVAPTARPRRVVVVGAGPAGMEAARAAAEGGHRVTVLERAAQAGGQVRLAATVPSRAELGDLVRNQVRACDRLGVDVRFGVEADAARVLAEQPDVVVVATGSAPARPWWAPGDVACIVDVVDVLEGRVAPEGRVVVLDELGFHQATSVAELLADRGCAVKVVSPGMVVGQDLGITLDMEHWQVKAADKGIDQRVELVPMAWDGEAGELVVQHHPTGAERRLGADWVVLAVPATPLDALYHELSGRDGVEVHRAGDCVAPRRAHAAVIEGDRIGASL